MLIDRVTRLTERDRLFKLSSGGDRRFIFEPGQFFMAGLPGYGEAPFSIASGAGSAGEDGSIELCIRAAGNLTNAIHRLKKGDTFWLRGPFGTGFNVNEMKGMDILFIAGGIGIVPARGLIKTILGQRGSFGALTLVYGFKSLEDILFADEMKGWNASGLKTLLTVDKPVEGWNGRVGVVTSVIPGLELDPARTIAVIIGPPVMFRFAIKSLWDRKISRDKIYLSLERRMKCGVGKCGHCQINDKYTCTDGPVFSYATLESLAEAL